MNKLCCEAGLMLCLEIAKLYNSIQLYTTPYKFHCENYQNVPYLTEPYRTIQKLTEQNRTKPNKTERNN